MRKLGNYGQGALGLVVLAVSIIIGAYLIGSVYTSAIDNVPASVSTAMSDTMDNAGTGLTLMAVGLIVGAAMFILALMGGRS